MCNVPYIKDLIRNLVKLVGGDDRGARKIAAHICGAGETDLSFWCNDDHSRVIPLDHFMLLDEATGYRGLKDIAHKCGFELVPIEVKPIGAGSLLKTLAQFSKRTGDLEYTALDAAEDGQLTPAEKRRIRDRIAATKNTISELEDVIS